LQLGDEEGLLVEWRGEGEEPVTHLNGRLKVLNFGEVLADYGYEQVIETNSGHFDLDVEWPGGPQNFQLSHTSGNMKVEMDDGRFLKTSGATEGTLRVAGILNLAEFVRRLSLDISYMFESGIPFDSIESEVNFRREVIEIPQFDVLGRTSRFQFVGVADIEQETLSGELAATLPVASNLPWVAALISGLPAAAAVYVISKLFTKQMDRFSSAIYSIDGPWGNPEVKFQRIFDDTAEQKELVPGGDIEPEPALLAPSAD